jgi:hypothetical protein
MSILSCTENRKPVNNNCGFLLTDLIGEIVEVDVPSPDCEVRLPDEDLRPLLVRVRSCSKAPGFQVLELKFLGKNVRLKKMKI